MSMLKRKFSRAETPRVVRISQPAEDEQAALVAGLLASPASISPKFFYDEAGCKLFTRICELDEYYPTRTEAAIFAEHGREIASLIPAAAQWIDLGCGDCGKSRQWIEMVAPARVIGVDIAEPWLRMALTALADEYHEVECLGVATDFTCGLGIQDILNEHAGAPVFFYPGSSIGNFTPAEALDLLRQIRRHCGDSGKLLIGVDLVKDAAVLNAAYNDSQGVTAEFNLNALHVVNRLLGSNFESNAFSHRAFFNTQESRIEMRLESRRDQRVKIAAEERRFLQGEAILTEYSYKYRPDAFADMLRQAGFGAHRYWADERRWFGVFLAETA